MQTLAILGASGHGKVVADIAIAYGWKHIIFFDDMFPALKHNSKWQVVGTINDYFDSSARYEGVIVAIGDNKTRMSLTNKLMSAGLPLQTVYHPSAVISPSAKIGIGSVIMPQAVLNADVTIGNACIINTGATVDHDSQLGDGVHISPGVNIAGNVKICDCAWLGIGSSISNNLVIGTNSIVGAGCVVIKNIEPNKVVVGNPAKFLREVDLLL